MKNKFLSMILVVALAAGVAGCGKNDSATADTSSQEASTEVPVVVEEDGEEAQEITSSRQEQFEKDKQYLLAKGLTDFGWKDYWNHFIAIEDNDERLEFAATYDNFVLHHIEFKEFYYGLQEKTIEISDNAYEHINNKINSADYDDEIMDYYYETSRYPFSDTPKDRFIESVKLSNLIVHSKYYDADIIEYEKNLSNIDIVNIKDEELIKFTDEDLRHIKDMYLYPQNSNYIYYIEALGESLPYTFSESEINAFEQRRNQLVNLERKDSEIGNEISLWHELIFFTGAYSIFAPYYALEERGVSNDTIYTEEEFVNRIEELFEEDVNNYRTYFGLEPYKESDEWTKNYARQRAYERAWTLRGKTNDAHVGGVSDTLDLIHLRPFTDADGNITDNYDSIRQIWYTSPYTKVVEWADNPTWSQGRLAACDYRNWKEDYQDNVRGENLAGNGFSDFSINDDLANSVDLSDLYKDSLDKVISLSEDDFEYSEYWAKVIEQSSFWALYWSYKHYLGYISKDFVHQSVGCCIYDDNMCSIAQEFYSLNNENAKKDTFRGNLYSNLTEYLLKINQPVIPPVRNQEEADEWIYISEHLEETHENANKETLETSNFVSMEELEREREAELKALEEKDKELTNSSSNSSIYDNPYAVSNSDDAKTIDELRAFLTKNGQQTKFFTMYSTWKQLYNDNKNDVSEQEWLNRFGQYLTDDEF